MWPLLQPQAPAPALGPSCADSHQQVSRPEGLDGFLLARVHQPKPDRFDPCHRAIQTGLGALQPLRSTEEGAGQMALPAHLSCVFLFEEKGR